MPPVRDTPLYYQFASTINGNKGLQLFHSIKTRFELKTTFRQADDQNFANLVDRLGFGIVTVADYQLLTTRNMQYLDQDEKNSFQDALYLCSKNENVDKANNNHLEGLNSPIAEIISENKPNVKLKHCEEEAGGLHHVIHLSVGCRVMLTRNLWTRAGLVNGALGTVTAIIYDNNTRPPSLPLYVLVRFDKYLGRTLFEDSVPIITEIGV